MRPPAHRRFVATLAVIAQLFAGVAVHVAPASASERAPVTAKHLQTIRDAHVVRGAQKPPCPEHKAAQTESTVKVDPAKTDAAKQACCKDGSCKCPGATPAAIESRAATAPAACPAPRADGICEAPPSRLRPSVFFRPPI